MKYFLFLISISIISCASNSTKNTKMNLPSHDFKIIKTEVFTLNNPPLVGKTISNQDVFLGGLSGLQFLKEENGEYVFNTITDRGPNGWQLKIDRPFLLPDFTPEIVTIKTNHQNQEFIVTKELKLTNKNGTPVTGLPNNRKEENPVDVFDMMYSIDPNGLDTEGLVSDSADGFWISEEYAPSLIHIDSKGKVIKRLMPGIDLPRIYLERKSNRGFEGIALEENKLFGFLQSPIPLEKDFSRVVEYDLETLKTEAEYFYNFEPDVDKIGDAISLGNRVFLVVEQNGKIGKDSFKRIYFAKANKSDEKMDKKLFLDLNQTPFKDVEKIEGIALINKRKVALMMDNDFAISDSTNIRSGITPINGPKSQMLIIEVDQDIY